MTPRPYLSYSQFSLFQRSPKEYKKVYLDGIKFSNNRMDFGKKVAKMREEDKMTGMEHIDIFLPKYSENEYEMTANIIIDKKKVKLFGIFDGVDLKTHLIGDDKTGTQAWTQKRADKNKQLTFYALIYWKEINIIPKLEINWIETEIIEGQVIATGKVKTFRTIRTIQDLINLHKEINLVWSGINKLCNYELAKLL